MSFIGNITFISSVRLGYNGSDLIRIFIERNVYARYARRPRNALNSIWEQYTRLLESNQSVSKS